MEPQEIFTGPWAEAWRAELTASDDYRRAAATWEGAIVLVMTEDPAMGIDGRRAVFLDLHRGECHGARMASDEDLTTAPFVLQAPPAIWKRALEGGLDPLVAVMTGKLKLVRGSLARLTPHVTAAKELVRTAGRVATQFPTGW